MSLSWLSRTRSKRGSDNESDPTSTTPKVGHDVHPNQIDDFFLIRGVIFIRGIVEHQPEDYPTFYLSAGSHLWPMRQRADKVHQTTNIRSAFSLSLDVSDIPHDISQSTMVICFRNDHIMIEAPAAARLNDDHFLRSEKVFWELVHSNENGSVIEIGSRARSGISRRNLFPTAMSYTGFDISPGENVDVVGDAHTISNYFQGNTFDFAFSVSVWEHLAMPWKAAIELNRVLKTGGVAMINSHQCWPSHEEPWDYFRFSEFSWAALFNEFTGFEILDCGHGLPAVVAPAVLLENIRDMEWHYAFLASRVVARKVRETSLSWEVPTDLVTKGRYPH